MKTIKKTYYHIKGTPKADENDLGSKGSNYLKAEIYYSEGGYSYFTYKNTPRGYFMSVTNVGRARCGGGYSETQTLFNDRARKYMIQEVTRQSKKAEANALAYFDSNVDAFVKEVFPEIETEVET